MEKFIVSNRQLVALRVSSLNVKRKEFNYCSGGIMGLAFQSNDESVVKKVTADG